MIEFFVIARWILGGLLVAFGSFTIMNYLIAALMSLRMSIARRHFCAGLFLLGLSTAMQASTGASRPNILFALADDASYPFMSAYGCSWVETPAFDRVAEQGLLFTRAYTPNAKCAPSRASILTGRNSWQLKEAGNHWPYFPAEFKTVTDVLAEHGYHVGYTGKGWAPGRAYHADGSRRDLIGKRYSDRTLEPPTPKISPTDYAGNFEVFLDARTEDEPFFFWYGSREPHRAYAFRSGESLGGGDPLSIDAVPEFWPDDPTVRQDMLDYAFELEYFDLHLARMLSILEERGELKNTVVVVTADNGMPFPRVKGQAYEYANHLPMAISWQNGKIYPGRVIESYVSFIDLAPTFLELAGIDGEEAGMASITGHSLLPLFRTSSAKSVRDFVLIGKERHDIGRPHDWGYPIRGILRNDFLYIVNFKPSRWPAGNPETGYLNTDGSPTKTVVLEARYEPSRRHFWEWNFGKRPSEELYHVSRDPDCLNNLAVQHTYDDLKARLREELMKRLKEEGDPRMYGKGDIFDNYPYADDRGRNFYERFMNGENLETGWINPSDIQPVDEKK